MQHELASARREVQQVRADNAALLRRLVRERDGHQTQLESAVAHWALRVSELEEQVGGDE